MTTQSLAETILDSEFFNTSYKQRQLWKIRVDPTCLLTIFSWPHLNHLLSTHRITNDRLRLSLADDFSTSNKVAFRQVRDQFGRPADFLSINELHRLMQLGVTGVLEAANEMIPAVEAFTTAIRIRFDARSSANAYFSFGSASGFGPHHDDHDVIVIQFCGRKYWHFFRTVASAERATVEHLHAPGDGDRGETMLLEEGDIMFVPKGTWHDVVALNEPSLHITVSIVYPTISDFFIWLLRHHQYGAPFRDIKMANDDLGAILNDCAKFASDAISENALRGFLKDYYAKCAAHRIAPSFPTLNRASTDDLFLRLPYSFALVGAPDGATGTTHTISALGRQYHLSEAEYHVLANLSHKQPSPLPAILASVGSHIPGRKTIIAAIEKLLDSGLISKAYPPDAGR